MPDTASAKIRGELGRVAATQRAELSNELRAGARNAWHRTVALTTRCANAAVGAADREYHGVLWGAPSVHTAEALPLQAAQRFA